MECIKQLYHLLKLCKSQIEKWYSVSSSEQVNNSVCVGGGGEEAKKKRNRFSKTQRKWSVSCLLDLCIIV